ncbi:MAG: hypothetical protein AAB814_01860 [Patescibacteria group bacterium]
MGILEEKTKRRVRAKNLEKIVLGTVAVAGLLSVALLAPNALQALKLFGWKPHKRYREVIARSRNRLIEHGLLARDEKGFLRLTSKGEAKLRELERREYKLPHPKRWDKKWRVLIFDIPEKRKYLREKIRNTLRAIGFNQLQKSVWIYPYDCEDLIALLKVDFKVGKDLLYLVVDEIENDKKLLGLFQISKQTLIHLKTAIAVNWCMR